jgi:hypothetical protein
MAWPSSATTKAPATSRLRSAAARSRPGSLALTGSTTDQRAGSTTDQRAGSTTAQTAGSTTENQTDSTTDQTVGPTTRADIENDPAPHPVHPREAGLSARCHQHSGAHVRA